MLAGFGPLAKVTGAHTARLAREALAADPDFDLVLLDLHLGDADGFDLLAELRIAHPAMPIVVISASDSNDDVARAIYLGAMGFVPKRSSNSALFEALNLVMSRNIYVPPMSMRSQAASAVVPIGGGSTRWRRDGPRGGDEAPTAPATLAGLGLTPRQAEVLALLMQGQSNKLIARALNLSVETIKDHVAALLRSLKVKTRTQAVLAVRHLSSSNPALSRMNEADAAGEHRYG